MSNAMKFIDRCPIICAAGKASEPNTTVRETLQEYQLTDQLDAVKHDLKIFDEKVMTVPDKLPKVENVRHRGSHDRVLNDLRFSTNTRYQQLITDLKETTYKSYWKLPLGETADSTPGLPKGLNVFETTFGHVPREHISAYGVILPNIPRYKVQWNSQVNHDNYKKMYNDYNLDEKIDRGYYMPPFNPENCAGYKTKYDARGLGASCSLKWFNEEPLSVATKRQVDYWNLHHSKISKQYKPVGVHKFIPFTQAFGNTLERAMHGMTELLKPECDPSLYKRDTLERLGSLNMLRQNIKKRFSPTFTLTDLLDKLAYYDQEATHFIPLRKFYEVIGCLHINLHRENLEALFKDVGIIQSDKINYFRFIDALKFDMEFGKQLDPMPKRKLHYCSESSAANFDRYLIDNSNMPAAGLSSFRYDLKIPPRKECESERDDLLTDDVKTLLRRSIFLQYNISYRDMFQPREKNFIRTLFENCGYKFAEGAFDELFRKAAKIDESGERVCVDTFYKLLKKHLPSIRLAVDELDCLPKPTLHQLVHT